MSSIDIKTSQKRFPVAKNLYGIFFEDINRAGDGGLYPELIRNRTFEDSIPPVGCTTSEDDFAFTTPAGWRDQFNHGEGLIRWVRESNIPNTPIPAWYADGATMSLDRQDTLNAHRGAALSVGFQPGGKVWNIGFVGIPQEAGKAYNFYIFAKAEQPLNIQVSIESGETVLCKTDLTIKGSGYIRYDAALIPAQSAYDARLVITCPGGGSMKLGFISLMPADTYNGHGLRKDLMEKLRDMRPTFLRFPGGCIVEGFTPETAMRFKNIIGPVWERPGHHLMWHYRTYNGLGFHEYLQLCEDLELEPLYVFNCGMTCQARNPVLMEGDDLEDMIQDTLDAIDYATAPADSKWGRVRASMGHPEPFKMNYMEIGNENHGPDYEYRYMKCYNAIQSRFPWIQFVANTHVENSGLPLDIADEHYYNTAEFFAENVNLYDPYDRKGPKIFLGEFAVTRGAVAQLYGAVGEAMFMVGMERNQDIVNLASYAPLFENIHYYAWFPNLIVFDNHRSFGIPTYYVWKLFGANRGDHVVYSADKAATLYRPVKGMASLIGAFGTRYRNAKWDGKEVTPSHEIIGHAMPYGTGFRIEEPCEEQIAENSSIHGVSMDHALIVLGDDEECKEGTFEVEIFAEEGHDIGIGVFSSRMPKAVYVNDETHPPKEWNAGRVHPLNWVIRNGVSTVTEFRFPEPKHLVEPLPVSLRFGEYNTFKYTVSRDTVDLYVNGTLVQSVAIPSFPSMASVVCDTEDEIIIKAVNIAQTPDPITITLDCDVQSDYEVQLLTGSPNDENSLDEPEKVHDMTIQKSGASREFVYQAPAASINVIKLKKV